ncbi:hypothetical protein SAMN04489841_0002 [Natrinema salaciae]|uniref:Uncharacterized protein n=1 Tax=Natrinema salaciae TaxID=1186196 RepID=A0A1H9T271_9EURY|nr:hypothetical protein SAMN04489841_0002 [Natrinema salaciae]
MSGKEPHACWKRYFHVLPQDPFKAIRLRSWLVCPCQRDTAHNSVEKCHYDASAEQTVGDGVSNNRRENNPEQ